MRKALRCSWCSFPAAVAVKVDGARIRLCMRCLGQARKDGRRVQHLERANLR